MIYENLGFRNRYISKGIIKGKAPVWVLSPGQKDSPWTLCQGTFAAYPHSWLTPTAPVFHGSLDNGSAPEWLIMVLSLNVLDGLLT